MAFKISDYIPKELLDEIKAHLRSRGNSAHDDYEDSGADEDSVTGALGSNLRQPWTSVEAGGRRWRWGVRSKKFVGKGQYAQEPVIGADAIVEFTLENEAGESITKGLLFQAKKDGSQQMLENQVTTMEGLAKGCSAIIDYSKHAYRALDGADYLESRHKRPQQTAHRDGERLGDYLADEFIECNVGVAGMSYDAVGRELRIPSDRFKWVTVPSEVGERIRITTVGPVRIP